MGPWHVGCNEGAPGKPTQQVIDVVNAFHKKLTDHADLAANGVNFAV